MTKRYDQAYFDKWYRNRRTRVNSSAEVRRKVAMAIANAEYFLRRPVRSVLDIGCGEGAWRGHVLALRPRASYRGYDSSEYVVERFGRARNIEQASFADLPSLALGIHDLVVCSDVLHYIDEREIPAGIRALSRAALGLVYLEVLTKEDEVIGDLDGLMQRPAAFYRKLFRSVGMVPVGPYCWAPPAMDGVPAEMEMLR